MANEQQAVIVPDLERMRHSAAHVLGQAVLKLYPDAKLGIGPATSEGFYYDFEFSKPISDEDLTKIEEEMIQIIKADLPFKQEFKPRRGVVERYKSLEQEYKLELLKGIEGEELSFYITGDDQFIDLCRGPHVESTGKIGVVKLLRLAGAYWKGDEKNKMLTRIYGTAFPTEEELTQYLKNVEEAKERDHRKLGKELGLFVFSDVVGKGLPLWTPRGSVIRRELERFIVDLEIARGYLHVYTPDIAKLELYEKSGHYPYYKESMYAPIEIDEEKFMLRPMTCPHHFELYLSQPRSYRELPMRIAELAKLYRYEQSGELAGLMRVRSFCLSDAHIICADEAQAKSEVMSVMDLIKEVSHALGLKEGIDYSFRLSLGDRTDKKKYYKDDKAWDQAEKILKEVLEEKELTYYEAPGEAAFYGPKIDFQMKNVLGKEDTAFTVQYDFVMPKRFSLKYTDHEGKDKEGIVIHRSALGCLERVIAFLIEHYGGSFPTWLAPNQVKIMPITEKHNEYAETLVSKFRENGIRAEIDERNEKLNAKIRDAELMKTPYIVVVGDKEMQTETVSVRARGVKDLGLFKVTELLEILSNDIKQKMLSPVEAINLYKNN